MKKLLPLIALILIIFLGAGLRFYQLGKAPAGLYIDEAGQGYSAYSILKTGKDEFGKPFPVVFRSFTDFKTPVYVYLIVPLIPVFGLTTFTVRFPSFFFSVLTFPLLYLLILRLNPDKKNSVLFSLLLTLLLAISPWHILFGRTNFECNVALFFYLLGVYLFYLSLKKPIIFMIALVVFAVALPAYHSERLLVPLTVATLFFRYRKTLLSKIYFKYLIVGGIIAFLITLPTLMVATTPGFLARASGLNIFSHQRQLPSGHIDWYTGFASSIVNSSVFLTTQEFLSLYSSYYSPRNMFYLGDYGPRSSFPNLGTFFVWQFPFYLLGLYILIKRKDLGELRFFTLLLLIIAPIPAAVTRDPYSSIRALPMVIPQLIIISLGIMTLFNFIQKKFRLFALLIFFILVIHSVLNLYSSVIILNEYYRPREWNYGLEQVADFIKLVRPQLPVVVDYDREEKYIQLAFFLKADPATYQRENFEVSPEEYYTNMNRRAQKIIGNVTVKSLTWKEDLKKDQYLIGDNLAISGQQIKDHHLTLIKEVLYPDQSVAYRIVRTNPQYENSEQVLVLCESYNKFR